MEPSGIVRGQVIYGDTRKPAAGVHVHPAPTIYATITDSQGRYSMEQLDAGKYTLYAEPPEGADYLSSVADVEIVGGMPIRQLNVTLERGSVITGELREKETGQPIRVPYVDIAYLSQRPKRSVARTETKLDGSFRIVVPPGKGELSTSDSVAGYLPTRLAGDLRWNPISRTIEIGVGETLTGQDLLFSKGMVVQGRVFDVEGKPVAGAVFQGVTEQPNSGRDGAFILRGLSPEQKSHFLVLHAQRRLGAKITITPYHDSKPLAADVELQPTKSATVRVIDEEKRTVANARVSLTANITMLESGGSSSWLALPVYGPSSTDADGKVTLPVLVIDARYSVNVLARGYAATRASFRVQAGNNPELLDVVLLASGRSLSGVVVDRAGNPLEGVQVQIMPALGKAYPRNQMLTKSDWLDTKKDGRFEFHDLPKVKYRLIATLFKPTGKLDDGGRPVKKRQVGKELRIEPTEKEIRIVLDVP